MKKILITLLAGVCALLILSSCGNDESDRSTVWDESDIVEHMELETSDSGLSWTFQTDDGTACNIAVVLTSAGQVDLYVGAGDTVATNPDKTAGVKIVDRNTRTCLDAATESLKDLE